MSPNEHGVLVGESGPSPAGWHSLAQYLACPKMYQFSQLRKLRAVNAGESHIALAVGSLFHAGRAAWFATQCSADFAHVSKGMEDEAGKIKANDQAVEDAKQIVRQYIEHYRLRPIPKVRAVEFLVSADKYNSTPFPGGARTARLDDVSEYVEANGACCIGEAKTTSDSLVGCVKEYDLHGQPLGQALLYKAIGEPFGRIAFVMLDVVKKPNARGGKCQFLRQAVPITDYSLSWYLPSLVASLRDVEFTKVSGNANRNPKACSTPWVNEWGKANFRTCEFVDLCKFGPDARTRFQNASGTFATKEECL